MLDNISGLNIALDKSQLRRKSIFYNQRFEHIRKWLMSLHFINKMKTYTQFCILVFNNVHEIRL